MLQICTATQSNGNKLLEYTIPKLTTKEGNENIKQQTSNKS